MKTLDTLPRRGRFFPAACTVLGASALALAVPSIASCVGGDFSVGPVGAPDGSALVDGSTPAETGSPLDGGSDAGSRTDAEAGAPPECDPKKPFNPAVSVAVIGDPTATDEHAVLTDDELTIFFASDRQQANHFYIYSATRPSRSAPFSVPSILVLANGSEAQNPTVTGDGNTIFFDSLYAPASVDAGLGPTHIFTSTRASGADSFGTATPIVTAYLTNASLTGDGNALYALNLQSGAVARLPKNGSSYGPQADLANTGDYTGYSPVSRDDLTMYINQGRPGSAFMGGNIWVYTRSSTTAAYPLTPVELTSVNTDGDERPTWLSADGCRLYIDYLPKGGTTRDIYVATRPL